MDLRYTFGENAEDYDRFRPRYCPELFQEIFQYANLKPKASAVEIGPGTGQATQVFLQAGCKVRAVELSPKMAAYLREKFAGQAQLTVSCCSFEDFQAGNSSMDVVYSATAFHWVPEEIGYPKILQMLKPGGTLALFWNHPAVSQENCTLYEEIQAAYGRHRLTGKPPKKYEEVAQTIARYGFRDVQTKLFHSSRTFSAEDYIRLLNTYSDHQTMEPNAKATLEQDIRQAILAAGGMVQLTDTMDLYLAKK